MAIFPSKINECYPTSILSRSGPALNCRSCERNQNTHRYMQRPNCVQVFFCLIFINFCFTCSYTTLMLTFLSPSSLYILIFFSVILQTLFFNTPCLIILLSLSLDSTSLDILHRDIIQPFLNRYFRVRPRVPYCSFQLITLCQANTCDVIRNRQILCSVGRSLCFRFTFTSYYNSLSLFPVLDYVTLFNHF